MKPSISTHSNEMSAELLNRLVNSRWRKIRGLLVKQVAAEKIQMIDLSIETDMGFLCFGSKEQTLANALDELHSIRIHQNPPESWWVFKNESASVKLVDIKKECNISQMSNLELPPRQVQLYSYIEYENVHLTNNIFDRCQAIEISNSYSRIVVSVDRHIVGVVFLSIGSECDKILGQLNKI